MNLYEIAAHPWRHQFEQFDCALACRARNRCVDESPVIGIRLKKQILTLGKAGKRSAFRRNASDFTSDRRFRSACPCGFVFAVAEAGVVSAGGSAA